jgi:hypothetical protein
MAAGASSEKFVTTYQSTRWRIPKHIKLQSQVQRILGLTIQFTEGLNLYESPQSEDVLRQLHNITSLPHIPTISFLISDLKRPRVLVSMPVITPTTERAR